jgi:riboflavin kinase
MEQLVFIGKVESGKGEGRLFLGQEYYLQALEKVLGFRPVAGTLNVRLDEMQAKQNQILRAGRSSALYVDGFTKDGRTFGGVLTYGAQINGQTAGLVIPLRTSHGPEIIEIVAPISLREKFGLKDGDEVKIVVESGR